MEKLPGTCMWPSILADQGKDSGFFLLAVMGNHWGSFLFLSFYSNVMCMQKRAQINRSIAHWGSLLILTLLNLPTHEYTILFTYLGL